MSVRKSENVNVSMRRIENEDKMRDVNVSIKKEILVLILIMMIKSQRVIDLPHLHS